MRFLKPGTKHGQVSEMVVRWEQAKGIARNCVRHQAALMV